MGQKTSKVSGSPLELYQKCHVLHTSGNVDEMVLTLMETARKMETGGFLLWQMVGRIENENQKTMPDEDDEKASEDGSTDDRYNTLSRLGSELSTAVGTPTNNDKHSLKNLSSQNKRNSDVQEQLADFPGFSVPIALHSLCDMLSSCSHISCKSAYLAICKAVWDASGQTRHQRLNNLKSMSDIAVKLVISALRLRLTMEELGAVGDAIRIYSNIRTFRKTFVSSAGHAALTSHFSHHTKKTFFDTVKLRYTVDPVGIVPALGGLRLILQQEYNVDNKSAIQKVSEDCGLSQVLCNIITHSLVDCTVLVEACATASLLMKSLGAEASLVPIAPAALQLLGGMQDWDLNEAAVKFVLENLCFLLYTQAGLCSLDPLAVVRTCRRVIIKHGLLSTILFHTVLILDKVMTIYYAEDRSSQVHDSDIILCYDTLGSALSRLVASVDQGTDALADIMAKVCSLIAMFTKHPRHKALMLSHACCHLVGKHVIRKPDLPEFILIPCVEIVGSVVGSEASALALQKTPDQVVVYKVQDSPVLLCRLLAEAKHNVLPAVRTAKAVFGTLLRLVQVEANAQQVFSCMSVAELWMWRNLREHLLKEAEREVNKEFIRKGVLKTVPGMLAKEAVLLVRQRTAKLNDQWRKRAEVVTMKWGDMMADPPPGVTWEADVLNIKTPVAEAIESTSYLAGMLNDALNKNENIHDYNVRYENYACKLQKWYRKKLAVSSISRASAKKTKQFKAAVAIQKRWRGATARRRHTTRLQWEATRREAAQTIQSKWRDYLKWRSVEGSLVMEYICGKLDIPVIPMEEQDKPPPGTVVYSHVVDLTGDNYADIVLNEVRPSSVLVFFYSPWCAHCSGVHKTYRALARTFNENPDVIIAAVNGEDNKDLVTRMKIPYYPYLIWVDAENKEHPYTAAWPKKPMTISQLIENFMALEIQRMWKGRKVKRTYMNMIENIRKEISNTKKRNMRTVCEVENATGLKELLNDKVSPDSVTDTGELPLNITLRKGNKELFSILLRYKADINAVDERGHSPAFYAVALGQCDILQMLAKHGANLTKRDTLSRTLLHVACEAGHETMASLLLHMGLERHVHSTDVNNYTALDYAMVSGLEAIAMKLLLKGVTMQKDIEMRLIYHSQIRSMDSISKLIIQQGLTDLEKDDGTAEKWTPLHYAACTGKVEVVRELIDSDISMEPLTAKRQTPLHLAAKKGNLEVAEMLFEAMEIPASMLLELHEPEMGSDDENTSVEYSELGPYIDCGGNTVLHYACNQTAMTPFAEKLLNLVTDDQIPLKNLSGNTPLHFAASKGIYFAAFKLASRLVLTGDTDLVNNCGNTALHLAVMHGHREVTTLLLDTGCDMEITDFDGNSLLHFACVSKKMNTGEICQLVKLLLAYNHPVNVRNAEHQTPLHLAAAEGHFPAVQELVLQEDTENDTRKNFINQQDREGNTALHYACQRSKMETAPTSPNYPYNNQMIVFLIVEGGLADVENRQLVTPKELVVNENVINRANTMRAERLEEEAILKLLD